MILFKKKNTQNVDYQYVYTVYDKVAQKCRGLFYSPTDANMLRTSLPEILMDYSFRDIQIKRIGRIEINSGIIENLNVKVISLDSYTFPHSRLSSKGDDLPLETLDSAMKDFKFNVQKKLDSKESEVINE